MVYYTIPPPPSLASLVKCFWVLESDHPYIHRSMADVCPELVFHYKGIFNEIKTDGRTAASFIAGLHGQSQMFSRFTINQAFGIFGAYLYPHAFSRFFGMPASELTNQMPDLVSLLGNAGAILIDKIFTAADNSQRASILASFLVERLKKAQIEPLPAFAAISYIIQQRGLISVKQVASDHYLSERQFERQFKQFSGFNPKMFARIVRFQSVMAAFDKPNRSLTDIALEHGYYDQSHFIHECKAFSGHHPRHYFSGFAEGTEWRTA